MTRAILCDAMPVIISMLRGVNVGGRNKIKMEALRALYEALKLRSPQTYVQSGNVLFLTKETNLALLSQRIQEAIERNHGFRPDVVLRTTSQMRHAIARNPFASRHGIDAAKLLVAFLASEPSKQAEESILNFDTRGEELHLRGSEVYIYFRNGIGQSKLSWSGLEKVLKSSYTGRNWNTVTKLHEMAESMEEAS